ncbi:helix-turn-helix domain-containing protein [Kitasatospora cinereorecta]|uniref:Helix-turn-helix domain-containing protein n=1 Tax=Kitasatospora cinereorecta TaxID=285560 RepID=A0ABW0VJ96_9ACTN
MEISDPKAIRALAHPLRLDLLELLTATGPATAARCGRALGTSQASCSFHLRQLAKYGFVEDAGPGRDRRERLWQVPDPTRPIRIAAAESPALRQELEHLVIERQMHAILAHAERQDAESTAWRRKAGIVTALAVLSAEEAADLREQWKTLLAPYVERTRNSGNTRHRPGQHHVRYFMAATPLPDLESGENQDESDH